MIRSVDQLRALPIRAYERSATWMPGYVIATNGISLRLGTRVIPVLGSGCSRHPAEARHVASWELYERLLMNAEVTGSQGRSVSAAALDGFTPRPPRRFEDVVPRPWHDTYLAGGDATGIAIHSEAEHATAAAVRELEERATLVEIWYGHEPILCERESRSDVTAGQLTLYSLDLAFGRFTLAIWHAPELQTLVAGSALHPEAAKSAEHAVEEAVMIFESVTRGASPRYNRAAPAEQYGSLKGPLHQARAGHLERRLRPGRGGTRGRFCSDIVVYTLLAWPDLHLVRATARDAVTPASVRAHHACDKQVVPDPFT